MDGPNVNWRMVSMLKDEWYDLPDAARLIEFGSCSLHVVHGALRPDKNQLVGMSLNIFVQRIISSKICILGVRGEFIKITGTDSFPAKLYCTRWVENKNAATVVIKILPNLCKYVDLNRYLVRTSKVFTKVAKNISIRPSIGSKTFFQGIANQLETFLLKFRSNSPMSPFLYEDLFIIAYIYRRNQSSFVDISPTVVIDSQVLWQRNPKIEFYFEKMLT